MAHSTCLWSENNDLFFKLYTGTTNNLLVVQVEIISSPNNATINCTFLSGFTGSAHCTVQYGTDPTFMNLPYSAVSTETGMAGDSVSVVLRERLNSSTVYYYTMSAASGDFTVVMQGLFTTPQYSKYMQNVYHIKHSALSHFKDSTLSAVILGRSGSFGGAGCSPLIKSYPPLEIHS